MTPGELLVVAAMVGYAIYRQSQDHVLVGSQRFKLAVIYGVVGLVVGGFNIPPGPLSWTLLAVSIALSVVVGTTRGRLQRVWRDERGEAHTQGTAVTIGLFLGMVAVKVGLGVLAYAVGASDDGGFGEVLIMIAVMVAVQAEIVWRRAQSIDTGRTPVKAR